MAFCFGDSASPMTVKTFLGAVSMIGMACTATIAMMPRRAAGGMIGTRELTEIPVPGEPTGITVGPFGNIWFTERTAEKIGRIIADGTIDEFPIPTPPNDPMFITLGPDGNLW